MISVISPIFNSEDCIEELVKRIINSTKKITKNLEIVLIDDGSTDSSWKKIKSLKKKFKSIRGIKLNRNYGQHQAIFVGIQKSSNGIVIVLDCDLQDNPKYIPEMYQAYKKYKKPVIIQHSYKDFALRNRVISNLFWTFLSIVSLKKFSPYLGNYLLIDKKIKQKYLKIKNIGYLYGDLIFQENKFHFIKKKRSKGIRKKTTYNLTKLINLGIQLILKYNIFNRFSYNSDNKLKKKIHIKYLI